MFSKYVTCCTNKKEIITVKDYIQAVDWGYGDVSQWAGPCKDGTQQSPIDLQDDSAVTRIYSAFQFSNYDILNSAAVKNNGHTVTISLNTTNTPTLFGGGLIGAYVLDHFHFHWESEHTVNGYRYPLEMHLVHYSTRYGSLTDAAKYAGGVAVLGVLFDLSLDDDEDFVPLIEVMEKVERYPNSKAELVGKISAKSFLPRDTADYYRYTGSLTTPACNEGVIWTVFQKTLPISADQVKHFEAVWTTSGPLTLNYRLTQPLNGRVVTLRSSPSRRSDSGSTTITVPTTSIFIFTLLSLIKNKLT